MTSERNGAAKKTCVAVSLYWAQGQPEVTDRSDLGLKLTE
jgi:hypothetical protein